MNSKDIGVALTGFGAAGTLSPGVSVARALREGWNGKLALTALANDPIMPGAWLPGLADRIHRLPPPTAGADAILRAIMKVHEESPFDALIPGDDVDVLTAARLRERLEILGINTLLPSMDRLAAVRPHKLPGFLNEGRLSGPLTVVVSNPADVAPQADQIGYPLYIKSMTTGSKLVFDAGQAAHVAAQIVPGGSTRIILQRHITGEEYNVAMVTDTRGSCVAMVIRRSLALNSEGRTVSGAVVDDPDVARFAFKILDALDWRGPVELVVARRAKDKDFSLCAVHGHLPSWSMLCHWAGANLATLLLGQILTTGSQSKHRARPGTMYVRGVAETAVPLEDLIELQRGRSLKGRPAGNGAVPRKGHAEVNRGLTVALTGISSFELINPGLGVARALRKSEGISRIYGLTYGTFDSGAFQPDLFDSSFYLAKVRSSDALLERLTEIHHTHPFDVLIPCLDGELPHFIDIAPKLRKMGVHTLLPSRNSLEERSKLKLFGGNMRADWGGFVIPESRIAKSKAETVKAMNCLGSPVVVKGPISHCISVTSERGAKCAWSQLEVHDEKSVIVQSRIVGPAYAVSAVCHADHRVVSTMTIKKLATCDRGSTWAAVHVEQPALEAAFADFLQSIKWVGPVEGEFIRDDLTDRFYLIEVNPRFTAWIYYSAALGSNQPYLAVRAAMGERVNAPGNDAPVVFMRSSDEIPLRASYVASLSTKGSLLHD
jgi:carbamoyl-phosphate synthase large subunit